MPSFILVACSFFICVRQHSDDGLSPTDFASCIKLSLLLRKVSNVFLVSTKHTIVCVFGQYQTMMIGTSEFLSSMD